ncbi:hypothetical protein [Paenibacillus zanthoxyli]|uniref:hypothetical protein n=1 Tax=Paenibacillus zanthoxyli TaxID=369399 RepID=UPI0012EBEE68|nr:hypothetical protein [Paenibacillus zanthoxyli]
MKNLLNEANALQHAYHQITEEVRSRWTANYDRYMARQTKPQVEPPKILVEKKVRANRRSFRTFMTVFILASSSNLRNH